MTLVKVEMSRKQNISFYLGSVFFGEVNALLFKHRRSQPYSSKILKEVQQLLEIVFIEEMRTTRGKNKLRLLSPFTAKMQ